MLGSFFTKKESVNLGELIKAGATIIDVRSSEEFASGHADGAHNIPLDVLEKNLDKAGGSSSTIITCCASGGRSSLAVNIFKKHGYTNVYNGGGWRAVKALQ
jgi:rhodanese-related sulfurtransferase